MEQLVHLELNPLQNVEMTVDSGTAVDFPRGPMEISPAEVGLPVTAQEV